MEQEAVLHGRVAGDERIERPRELEGVALHPLRVLARAGVLGLERTCERRDGLAVGTLDQCALTALQLDQVAQVARVEQELLLVGAAPGAAKRQAHAAACEPLDDRQELERPERLQQQRVGARLAGVVLDVVEAREQDDADVLRRTLALQPTAELDPVDTGQADVEHDDVRPRSRDSPLSLGRVAGVVHVDVHGFEGRPEEVTEPRVVIDDQQAHESLLQAAFPSRHRRPRQQG